ncbi:MAG: single-stranded DNA-binding protein, partial [Epulopiscium sp.]|nr:single-stranded DNA-binding protein [Candidatus Epulonipiscium sp.]
KAPELRYTSGGIAVTRFTLAVNRNYTNQQGEREADFIPVVVWRAQAETSAKYLGKGRLVAVSGRIQTGSYESSEGQRKYTTDVVADDVRFLDWGKDKREEQEQPETPGFTPIDSDEKLPF